MFKLRHAAAVALPLPNILVPLAPEKQSIFNSAKSIPTNHLASSLETIQNS